MAARLSVSEREEIAVRRARGESMRQIAAAIGRHPSTVCREIKSNVVEWAGGRYRAWSGQAQADRLARRPRAARLAIDGELRQVVVRQLNKRWSPRQIAVGLRLEFPNRPEMRVSHETIYQSIYLQSRGNLRAELKHQKALRTGRTRRRAAAAGAITSNRAWLGLNISQRPPEAADRAVAGHWEGDLLIGRNGKSAIATLVERQTRFVILVALPQGRVSDHVVTQLAHAMTGLPASLRRSLTWDQGSELARHAAFSIATGCSVFFCDPHSPWQRGSNENTNGLLRDYFPSRHTDFGAITQTELDHVADELNARIRQTLAWATPAAKLAQLLAVATAA